MSRNDNINRSKPQVIYSGFDGLDVSFKGSFPENILQILENAKLEAQNIDEDCLTFLNGFPVKVAATGAKGGYKYRFDTGLNGEVWFLKHSTDSEQWNIRVSAKASALAEKGFNTYKKRLYERFEKFGATVLQEAIGRVDYAVDFLDSEFVLNPESFVAHAKTTIGLHGEGETPDNAVFNFSMSGRKFSSVTIGKMPQKQVIVYDKRKEVIAKKKHFWWDFWGLDKDNKENRVWRVELRAGKRYLKETWDISTWQDLEDKIGDMYLHTLKQIRMVLPETNSNTTRMKNHPFWDSVKKVVNKVFEHNINGCLPGRVVQVARENLKDTFRQQIAGLAVGYSYLNNIPIKNIDLVINRIRNDLEQFLRTGKEKIAEKYDRALNRYYFTGEGELCLA
jgi:hypothetical protein